MDPRLEPARVRAPRPRSLSEPAAASAEAARAQALGAEDRARRPGPLLGSSRAVRRLLETIERVASTPRTTVLITGETGVGKETVAREIHARSARAGAAFVALPCAGLRPERLALALRRAAGGTLFLDEVGALERELQELLLCFLSERRIGPAESPSSAAGQPPSQAAGGPPSREAAPGDVRVIASTRLDLARRVAERRLREDLHYRLNVLSIEVPPLRERRDDLPELVEHCLARLAEELGLVRLALSPQAHALALAHAWPGNLRELRNALERGALRAQEGVVAAPALALPDLRTSAHPAAEMPAAAGAAREAAAALPIGDGSLRAVEEALIRRVLADACGNRSRAARVLGVNRTTLYNKLRLYGITSR
jgi:DNA-binding NtrC family response regulator